MMSTTPIYSVENECQDCCKCIRQCPVKAIKVVDGHARVIPESCIVCGHCVEICPSGAKRVRDDIESAQALINSEKTVLVSLAPSFASEFPNVTAQQLIKACQALGFSGVSETALGAQIVSAQLGTTLDGSEGRLFLTSACPVAVRYIQRKLPRLAKHITPILSPMLAHGKMLREHFGNNIGIVFVGPCYAKKLEAERHPETIDIALTFADLRRWFEKKGIDPATLETEAERFVPYPAEEGSLYPIDGGMNEVTKANCRENTTRFVSVSGIKPISEALGGLNPTQLKHNICLELLACEGGCINGPASSSPSVITSRLKVQDNSTFPSKETFPRQVQVEIKETYPHSWSKSLPPDEETLRNVLHRIGKQSPADELNCAGCGYDSCRDFAAALLEGKAETNMCFTYMRQLAQKKMNVLFRTMPYGVVIVNQNLKIVESNERFATLAGNGAPDVYAACPGMEGATLERIFPFPEIFQHVLDTQEEIIRRNLRLDGRLLSASVFNIEPHRLVGAIILDVTQTESRREEIITKARLVIKNTLANAQEIAFLIGKNAAESECILNSVIEGALPAPDEEES